MSDEAQHLLRQLIQEHGIKIVDNPRRLESLIKDYARGQYKREVNLWLLALREGIVQELQNKQLPIEMMISRSAKRLHEDCGIDLQAAIWTLESWSTALGLSVKTETPKSTSKIPTPTKPTIQATQKNPSNAATERDASNTPKSINNQNPSANNGQNSKKQHIKSKAFWVAIVVLTSIVIFLNIKDPSIPTPAVVIPGSNQAGDDPVTGMKFVTIQPGCFMMGSPESEPERNADERQHRVCIEKAFDLGQFEVTDGQWRKILGESSLYGGYQGCDANCPADGVTWNDVQFFLAKLNQQTGLDYRLPTEAEWEYAARAGTATPFYTGDCINSTQATFYDHVIYNGCVISGIEPKKASSVGSFPPNPWGLYDMLGNSAEWTCSRYEEKYAGQEKQCDDQNIPNKLRVLRGGFLWNSSQQLRSAIRFKSKEPNTEPPEVRALKIGSGFRLVRTTPLPFTSIKSNPATATPISSQTKDTPLTGMEFIAILPDCFMMGSPDGEAERRFDYKELQHQVCVDGFFMGRNEVTVGEFKRFVEQTFYLTEAETNGGCFGWASSDSDWEYRSGYNWRNPGFKQTDQHPVVCVSWNDTQAYIRWLNGKTGKNFRLPTEAEWEFAARSKTTEARYWRGDTSCQYANVADQTAKAQFSGWDQIQQMGYDCADGYVYTAPVGSFQPNNYGLYDMLGNVNEWTCSKKGEDGGSQVQCANGPGMYMLRGGAHGTPGHHLSEQHFGTRLPPRVEIMSWDFDLYRTDRFITNACCLPRT